MDLNYQILLKQNLQDLNPLFVGMADCPPEEPALIDARYCPVLYRLRHGRCNVKIKGADYRINTGDFFVIPVGEVTEATAIEHAPWTFEWIGFNGTLAYNFLQLPTVFSLPKEITQRLYDLGNPVQNMGLRLASDLLLIYSHFMPPHPDRTDYVRRVVDHILSSFMFKISVTELATDMGIHLCHLSRLFAQKMGCSIQKYLLAVRIANAKRCLNQGYSVKETALLCGFQDTTNFSKLFKKETGLAPSYWKTEMNKRWENCSPTALYPPQWVQPFTE